MATQRSTDLWGAINQKVFQLKHWWSGQSKLIHIRSCHYDSYELWSKSWTSSYRGHDPSRLPISCAMMCHAHACPDWSIWPWELKHTGSRCKRLSHNRFQQISTASSPAVPGDCRRAANALNSSAWQTVGHGLRQLPETAEPTQNYRTYMITQSLPDYSAARTAVQFDAIVCPRLLDWILMKSGRDVQSHCLAACGFAMHLPIPGQSGSPCGSLTNPVMSGRNPSATAPSKNSPQVTTYSDRHMKTTSLQSSLTKFPVRTWPLRFSKENS